MYVLTVKAHVQRNSANTSLSRAIDQLVALPFTVPVLQLHFTHTKKAKFIALPKIEKLSLYNGIASLYIP